MAPFTPPRLGPGLVYHPSLDALFRSHPDLIRTVEIEPQPLWIKGAAAAPRGSASTLEALRSLPQTAILHGVGYPIGGAVCDHDLHTPTFRSWADRLGAAWASEHLSLLDVTGARGAASCGFLMPPLQTDAAVMQAAANIVRRRQVLGRPFAFETGVNYFAPRPGEMDDGAFFAAVAEAADCGVLLDLNNLWCNDRNGRGRVGAVLARLPLERVWEVHLAGAEHAHGLWLDAHSGAISAEVVALAREVIPALPNLGAVVFEIAPDRLKRFGQAAVLRQMEVVAELWSHRRSASPPAREAPPRTPVVANAPSCEAWEALIATEMLPPSWRPATPPAIEVRALDRERFAIYRDLVASARRGSLADLVCNSLLILARVLGEVALTTLLAEYVAATPPSLYPSDEALAFRDFVTERGPWPRAFMQMLTFETALIEAVADDRTLRMAVDWDVETALAAVAGGGVPDADEVGSVRTLEVGAQPEPYVRLI